MTTQTVKQIFENPVFESFTIKNGLLVDMSHYRFPVRLYGWKFDKSTPSLQIQGKSTFYGFIFSGEPQIKTMHGSYNMKAGQYFCFSEEIEVAGGEGIIIEVINYHGLNQLGGPVESKGRLRYVDGCTDTLLVSPVRMGDPCLNALFFPPMTDQTQHTHPSLRIGIVMNGVGECLIPGEVIPLNPGVVFIIHEEGLHKFRTNSDQGMTG